MRVRGDEGPGAVFDAIGAEGSSRMLAADLKIEVGAHVSSPTHEGDEREHRLVVRIGQARATALITRGGTAQGADPARSTTAGAMKGGRDLASEARRLPLGQTGSEGGRDADHQHRGRKDSGRRPRDGSPRHIRRGRPRLGPFELAQHRVTGE